MEYELTPIYSREKSFYRKAIVEIEDNKKTLYSYNTKVAIIENKKAVVLGIYSNTTLRHIKEFLKQDGFNAESKAQIEKDYYIKEGEKNV